MASITYMLVIVPAAQQAAANQLLNALPLNTMLMGDSLTEPMSANALDPATHYCGGWEPEADCLAAVQGASANLPTPTGGWPAPSGLTQAEAQAAADALIVFAYTKNSLDLAVAACREAAFAIEGLQSIPGAF